MDGDLLTCFVIVSITTFIDTFLGIKFFKSLATKSRLTYLYLVLFVLSVSSISLLFYSVCSLSSDITKLSSPWKGVGISFLYLSLINQKFAGIKKEDGKLSQDIGLVAFYNMIKSGFYHVINNENLNYLTSKLKQENTLDSLHKAAKLRAKNDLFNDETKRNNDLAWIAKIINEIPLRAGNPKTKAESEAKEYLLDFVNTGGNSEIKNS